MRLELTKNVLAQFCSSVPLSLAGRLLWEAPILPERKAIGSLFAGWESQLQTYRNMVRETRIIDMPRILKAGTGM